MPFIKEALDDVYEPKPAPEGEYDLRIVKAEPRTSEKGNEMIFVLFAFEDVALDAPPFSHYLLNWDSSTPEEQVRMRKLEIKRFCACFGAEEGFDAEDLVGLTGTTFVRQEIGDDDVSRNKARFPKLRE